MTKEVLLGAHMSIAGGVHMAIERACSINCTAMQIFVKNNMQWFARPLSTDEIRAFLDHQQRAQLGSVFAHANYLINLAATNPQFHANSLRALAEELIRADHLRLPFLVMHPGAHLGAGEEAGLEKITGSMASNGPGDSQSLHRNRDVQLRANHRLDRDNELKSCSMIHSNDIKQETLFGG